MTNLSASWLFDSGNYLPDTGSAYADDWVVTTTGGSTPTQSLSSTTYHSSPASMQIDWIGDGGLPQAYVGTRIGGTACTAINIDCWLYVPTGSPDVQFATGDTSARSGATTAMTTKDAWVHYTASIPFADVMFWSETVTPLSPGIDETTYVMLIPTDSSTAGTVYVDDVTFTFTSVLTPPETATITWGFESSLMADGNPWYVRMNFPYGTYEQCTPTQTTERAHSGTHSMKIEIASGLTYTGIGTYTTVPPLSTATISAWVYVPTGSTPITLWNNSAWATSTLFDTWEQLTITLGAGEFYDGGPLAYFGIEAYDAGNPITGPWYVDDVKVELATPQPGLLPAVQSPTVVLGSSFSTTALSGLPGATYTISPTPTAGLSFDTSTGVLSGTPTTAGTTVYTVTGTLGTDSATAQIVVAVAYPPGIYNDVTGPTISVQLWRRDQPSIYQFWDTLPSTDLMQVSLRRGRSRPDFGYDAGVMTVVLDNASGQYDPDWTGSDWYPLLAAGTKFRLVATWDEVDYVLFTGYLESNQLDHGFAPTSTLTVADAISRISAIPTTAMADALYDTEYDDEPVYDSSGTPTGRLVRLLAAGLGGFLGDAVGGDQIDVPDDLLRKLTPIRTGANFTQILNECALAEGGVWYITKDNLLGMYRADNKFDRPTRLYLSDSRDTNTVEYDSIQVSPGAAILCNDARLSVPGRNGNDEQYWWQYSASVTSFGIKSIQMSAPIYNTDWAQTLCKYYSRRYAEPTSYASRVEFSAHALDVLYPDLLSCELADLLTVERTTLDGRTLTWNCVIESIEHQITPNSWRVAFDTSPVHGFYPSL